MAFGLKNAPSYFSRLMFRILGNLRFVLIYFDDFYIASKSAKEHLKHITIVIEKLKEANSKINFKKCNFFKKTIKILGHIVSKNNLMMDPDKQFIGLCGYYRKFIENFAGIAATLYSLLRKDKKWIWTQECQEAFDKLKTCLTSYPILRQPDFDRSLAVHTDACGVSICAILTQMDDKSQEYVVA